jgi:hypothetical protein
MAVVWALFVIFLVVIGAIGFNVLRPVSKRARERLESRQPPQRPQDERQ